MVPVIPTVSGRETFALSVKTTFFSGKWLGRLAGKLHWLKSCKQNRSLTAGKCLFQHLISQHLRHEDETLRRVIKFIGPWNVCCCGHVVTIAAPQVDGWRLHNEQPAALMFRSSVKRLRERAVHPRCRQRLLRKKYSRVLWTAGGSNKVKLYTDTVLLCNTWKMFSFEQTYYYVFWIWDLYHFKMCPRHRPHALGGQAHPSRYLTLPGEIHIDIYWIYMCFIQTFFFSRDESLKELAPFLIIWSKYSLSLFKSVWCFTSAAV